MGQSINVESKPVDSFCMFTTDRVLTGQDPVRFASLADAEAAEGFPALLAARLFAADEAVDNVYVAANDVIVGRTGEWDQTTVDAAETTISNLYRFYE